MTCLNELKAYRDSQGNVIEYEGPVIAANVQINFIGRGNRLFVGPNSRIDRFSITFYGDDAACRLDDVGIIPGRSELGYSPQRFGAAITLASECVLNLGAGTTSSSPVTIVAAEKTAVTIGRDCMFAGGVMVSTTDWHLIYDVSTGERLNKSRSISIGGHVWIGDGVWVMAGACIGDGSVIGGKSIVKGNILNNCSAAGAPARVLRRNVAWERTVTIPMPHCDPHGGGLEELLKNYSLGKNRSPYWNMTREAVEPVIGPENDSQKGTGLTPEKQAEANGVLKWLSRLKPHGK